MALLSLVFLALLTLFLMRLLAARATFSCRTFLTCLLVGVVVGPFAMPVVHKLINAYGSYGQYQTWLDGIGATAVLLLLACALLFRRGAYRVTSVADAFLLAFMIGFGFDLLGAFLAASAATAPLAALSYFPPFTMTNGELTAAGLGYWCGLVALAVAATLRFARRSALAWGIGATLLLFVGTEWAGLLGSSPWADRTTFFAWFSRMTLHGHLTPWLALLGLIGLSVWEAQWVAKATGGSSGKLQFMEEWGSLMTALAGGKRAEFCRLSRLYRLRRQSQLARAELAHSPQDESLKRLAQNLEERVRALEKPSAESAVPLAAAALAWASQRRWQIVLVAAFLFVVVLLPMLPDQAINFLWTIPVLESSLSPQGLTLLNLLLGFALVRRYVTAGSRPFSTFDADELARFYAELAVLQGALASVVLVVTFGLVEEFYGPGGTLQVFAGVQHPGWNRAQLTTVMLLTACVATGITLARSQRWRSAPLALRRAAAVRNTVTAAAVFAGAWIGLIFFQQVQAQLHTRFGARLYLTFERNGNAAGDTFAALLTAGFSFVLFRLLSLWSRRAQAFLAPDTGKAGGD
ncbi:MAG: hypothetical protein ACRD3A_02870 [Terriglobales bacterium]